MGVLGLWSVCCGGGGVQGGGGVVHFNDGRASFDANRVEMSETERRAAGGGGGGEGLTKGGVNVAHHVGTSITVSITTTTITTTNTTTISNTTTIGWCGNIIIIVTTIDIGSTGGGGGASISIRGRGGGRGSVVSGKRFAVDVRRGIAFHQIAVPDTIFTFIAFIISGGGGGGCRLGRVENQVI